MAITKNIVDMMGGTIQVESETGKGTEFTIMLECETSGEIVKREPVPEWSLIHILLSYDAGGTTRIL